MKGKESRIARRTLLTSGLSASLGVTLLGSAAPAQATPTSDFVAGDPQRNTAFPYASDGLLYNFVSGSVVSVDGGTLSVLVPETTPPRTVSVAVPPGVEVLQNVARGVVNDRLPLAGVHVGDRVDVGTSFLSQGLRSARWITVNGLTSWSDVVDLGAGMIETVPSGDYRAKGGASAVRLSVTPATRVDTLLSDVLGDVSGLSIGDRIYWTGVADSPGLAATVVDALVVAQVLDAP